MSAFHGILDELLNAVLDSLFLLVMGLGCIHASGSLCRITACIGHHLHKDYVFARLCGVDRSGHTCAAGADDHDVRGKVFVFLKGFTLVFRRCKCAHIRTCRCKGFLERAENGVAGDCRSGQSVHIGALRREDPLAEHLHSKSTDILCLVVTCDLYIFDLVLRHCRCHCDLTAESGACLSVGARNKEISVCSLGTCRNFFAACLCKGSSCRSSHCVTCKSSSAHAVNVSSLVSQDRLFENRDRRSAYIGSLLVPFDRNVRDAAVASDLDCDLYRSAESVSRRSIRTGLICAFHVFAYR